MWRHRHTAHFILPAILACCSCKDPYVSPYTSPATGYLVVEGYISGNTTTQFTLSRTIPLPGDSTLPTVNGATVQIQASDGSSYTLAGQGNGVYSSPNILTLTTQLHYRLHIKTTGDEYLSDYIPFKPTPAIDSLNFVQRADNSVTVYANAHDAANNTHYYMWNYDQAYEYHSAEETLLVLDHDTTPPQIINRPVADSVYRCWLSSSSSTIILANSTKLAQDVIYEAPVKMIPPDDIQTSVLYSILVRQYSLTADGYTFMSLMQKNSETLGSIFDAQPTQLTGNVHSVTTPAERIIGWVSAGTVHQQRLWISRSQIVSHYAYSCPTPDSLLEPKNQLQLLNFYYYGGWTPTYALVTNGTTPAGFYSNATQCLVCTARGGVNKAPSYWPN